MVSFKKTALCGAISAVMLGLGNLATTEAALTLTFTNGTATAAKPGACSGIAWTAGNEFRMCDPSGAALGGGVPLQKNTINGGEVYTFNDAGVLTGVTGTPGNPGATYPGSAAPGASTNVSWQQSAGFFGPAFNFLAPYSGSLAGTAYGNATYIGGAPAVGINIPFISVPVMEAQWGGTWFPLGQASSGVTFTADISNVVTVGNTTTFDFHMYANELINAAEDPGSAGFTGWTAQWHQQGTGTYTDSGAPTVSTVYPASSAADIPTTQTEIVVTYNKPMNTSTVTSTAITLSGGTVAAPTAYNNNTVFSFPIASLPLGASHTVTFNAGPQDVAGTAVSAFGPTSFTTVAADATAPTVTTRSPAASAQSVTVTSSIAVTFSERMKSSTASSITVTGPSGNVAGTVTFNAGQTTFTFSPSADLANLTTYTVTVASASAEDASGNNLATDDTWTFITAPIDITIDRVLEDNGTPDGLLSGCTINPRAKFDPTLLAMLLGSFGWLAWRRRRSH